jgi:hypothetical protein
MIRTKLLSFFMLIILSLDLLLGITNVYSERFLDTNGDNYNVILMANSLFGQQRTSKAITNISHEKMISHNAVIKKFANFLLYTNDELSTKLLQEYMNKVNQEIIITEYSIDQKLLQTHSKLVKIDTDTTLVEKKKYLHDNRVGKYKVYLIPHKHSDMIFDEALSKTITLYHRCSVVMLKYVNTRFLDDIQTTGFVNGTEQSYVNRYTSGDLINLHNNIQHICFKFSNPNNYTVVNTAYYLHNLLFTSGRIMLYGQQSSYVLSIYPTSASKLQIERKHTASNSLYCFFANKLIKKFGISDRFISLYKSKLSEFNYVGKLIHIGQFRNHNMLSNISKYTEMEEQKLSSILQCLNIDEINDNILLHKDKSFVMLTQFGALYFEYDDMTPIEVEEVYEEIIVTSATIRATDHTKFKTNTASYKLPPFIPLLKQTFKAEFGLNIEDIKQGYVYYFTDYYNHKFYQLSLVQTFNIDKIKHPSYSLLNMIMSEAILPS